LDVRYDGALPSISGSAGVLAPNTIYTQTLNLANFGNGTFFLGSTAGGTYRAPPPRVGANNTHPPRGGGHPPTGPHNVVPGPNNPVPGAALANGTAALSNGGGTVNFTVPQGYTGTTALTAVTATYLNDTVGNNNNNNNGVFAANLTSAGSGYTSAPTV